MYELSEGEIIRLAAIVRDQHGQFLLLDKFTEEALQLLEDVPGLECLPDAATQSLINELWVIYHDRGHSEEALRKSRSDH